MDWNRHWVAQKGGRKLALPQDRLNGRKTGSGDFAQAVANFNAMHPVHELLTSAGVELQKHGREWHTINGCPLPGCTSTHDAFRVHIDRMAGDSRGPQWCCRRCGRGGDALRLAMYLSGFDPSERGDAARFLREQDCLSHPTMVRPGGGLPRSKQPSVRSRNGKAMATAQSGTARVVSRCPADPLRWDRADVLRVLHKRPSELEREALDERAAILEFEVGMTRDEAESAALREVASRERS